jgi:hypothetical protein
MFLGLNTSSKMTGGCDFDIKKNSWLSVDSALLFAVVSLW